MSDRLTNHERSQIERIRRMESNEDWAMAKETAFKFLCKSKVRRTIREEALAKIGFKLEGIYRRPRRFPMFNIEVLNKDVDRFERIGVHYPSLGEAEREALKRQADFPRLEIRIIETVGTVWRNF